MTEYWKKKIDAFSLDNPVEVLKRDKALVKKLKEENAKLREEIRKLLENNQKLVKLVELMEEKIKKLTEDMKKNYVYSYEHGGWVEKDALDKGKVKLAPSMLSVDSINNQLAEILRMIERHRIKDVD